MSLLLVAACQTTRDLPSPEQNLADFVRLAPQRDLEFVAREGPSAARVVCRREGGDVRALEGMERVNFAFVFGIPEGFEHPTTKSIWAEAPEGPRLFFLDAWLWSLECDPPLSFLLRRAVVGTSWHWDGRVSLERRDLGPATLTLTGIDELLDASGPLEALRIDQHHPATGVRIRWRFARGLGLIDVEIEDPGAPLRTLVWAGVQH